MDRIARAKANEREELFRVVAAQMELHPVNIEKDFWVCWLLKQLFTIAEFEGWLVFKGGSCSRVARVQGWLVFKGGSCSRVERASRSVSTSSSDFRKTSIWPSIREAGFHRREGPQAVRFVPHEAAAVAR